MELIDAVMIPGGPISKKYILMQNSGGKRWVLEEGDLRTALDLYQPTALKGLAVKAAMPFMSTFDTFSEIAGLSRDERALEPAIADLANELFGDGWSVSAFGGTPSSDQKVTLQFYKRGVVLGYIKITDQPRLLDLFASEGECLARLASNGVAGVPRCLFVGERSGYGCFAQTCVKSPGYRVPTRLKRAHWDFLRQLSDKTSVRVKFSETDASATLADLARSCLELPTDQRVSVLRSIEDVRNELEGMDIFCACHGDFTPWNTALNKDGLSAFDFEYSRSSYPPFLDAIHFFCQVQLFVRSRCAADISRSFKSFAREFQSNAPGDPYVLMRFYLLVMIELFLARDELDKTELENMDTRIELLRLI